MLKKQNAANIVLLQRSVAVDFEELLHKQSVTKLLQLIHSIPVRDFVQSGWHPLCVCMHACMSAYVCDLCVCYGQIFTIQAECKMKMYSSVVAWHLVNMSLATASGCCFQVTRFCFCWKLCYLNAVILNAILSCCLILWQCLPVLNQFQLVCVWKIQWYALDVQYKMCWLSPVWYLKGVKRRRSLFTWIVQSLNNKGKGDLGKVAVFLSTGLTLKYLCEYH